jgi:hypothetical protein
MTFAPDRFAPPGAGKAVAIGACPMIGSVIVLSFLCVMVAVGRAHSQYLDVRDARWKIRMEDRGPLAN